MAQAVDAKTPLSVGGTDYQIYRLAAVTEGHVDRLPFSLKILLENLLRHADSGDVSGTNTSADPATRISPTNAPASKPRRFDQPPSSGHQPTHRGAK